MILVSYTNARGETVVLDDLERTFVGELYGREGVEAPALDYVETTYADGSTEILAVNVQPRDVTLYFWAPTRQPHHRVMLEEIKQKLIQSGSKTGSSWGKLMTRRPDGRALYLNCVYTGGFDEFVREYPNLGKFSLTFHAEDPLFHDDFDTVVAFGELGSMLYFEPEPRLYFDAGIYMKSSASTTTNTIRIDGEKVYPTITITGPASNIGIINVTTGKRIALSSDVILGIGDTITITTDKLTGRAITMTQSGITTNLLPKLTASSSLNWWLERGDNRVRFQNASVGPSSSVRLSYKEGYLSAE